MERERFRNAFVTIVAAVVTMASLVLAPCVYAAEPDTAAFTVRSERGVVAADHPLASKVGADLLARGGGAVDAAVGTLLTLGVVDAFSSGLGGGGFCLVRPIAGDVSVLDFRERAPQKATRDMYIRNGKADIGLTMLGGLAIGVPGEPRGLEALHQKYGKLPWKDVVEPARRTAKDGFVVTALLPEVLAATAQDLEGSTTHAAVYRKGDHWVTAGERLVRPDLAKTLELLQTKGAAPFYDGEIATEIVTAANAAGGIFTEGDLRDYRVTWRDPLVGSYRGYEVYTMPPPSSGGTTILETLNILERYDLHTLGYNPESVHRIVEALKHAFADRARWLGDADFVQVPTERLVSKDYAASLVVLPGSTQALEAYGSAAPPPTDHGTTHVSVIDEEGNMVACTSTINTRFGSGVYVGDSGIVLNNEMGDFTAQPGVPNNYGLMGTEQNAVAPRKRPLSSMSPTLVVHEGEPFMAVGASGGPTIITGTLLAMIRVIDWGWTPADAIARPRIHHQWMPNTLEVEQMDPLWVEALKRRGHAVAAWDAYNSVQMVLRLKDGMLVGVSDPRKMGRPAGVPTAPRK